MPTNENIPHVDTLLRESVLDDLEIVSILVKLSFSSLASSPGTFGLLLNRKDIFQGAGWFIENFCMELRKTKGTNEKDSLINLIVQMTLSVNLK